MSSVKIAVIGAGSFVFGPSVLTQTLMERRLDDVELALMDVSAETIELMAGVARRMAREQGLSNVTVTTHTTRDTALDRADFVICSAAAQMRKRFEIDVGIARKFLPDHPITEFGGIYGIAYSLRQMELIRAIASDMRRLCPNAWLLNVANPLPRVTQAAHEAGVKTVGLCSVSIVGYGAMWKLFTGGDEQYPYTASRERFRATIGGLNHFCWLTELSDAATGKDLYPQLRQMLRDGKTAGQPRCERLCLETGYLLLPNDGHTADFLPPVGKHVLHETWHGGESQRAERTNSLREMAEGSRPLDELWAHPSWERPIDIVAATMRNETIPLHSLNLVNEGQIAELPRGVFVETPALATPSGPKPQPITMPQSVLPLCHAVIAESQALVEAGQKRSRAKVHDAVELDPTIVDKSAGREAIDQCLLAHQDLIGSFN